MALSVPGDQVLQFLCPFSFPHRARPTVSVPPVSGGSDESAAGLGRLNGDWVTAPGWPHLGRLVVLSA